IALFDAVMVSALKQLARPRDPAAGPRALAVVHQGGRQPERASRGARHRAARQELLVRARPELRALRILANQVRGRRETFEIIRLKRLILIRGRQEYVRVRPRAT